MSKYPEHEKLEKLGDYPQVIGEFLEWMSYEKQIQRAIYSNTEKGDDNLYLDNTPTQDLLAEYFEIDRDKLEQEKQQMLEEMRKLSNG